MRKLPITIFLLALSLAFAPVASLARLVPVRAGSSSSLITAPIGSVASLETVAINGNQAGRQGLLWNGDIVQAAPGASVQVLLASIGNITLRGGSAVKLAANGATHDLLATVLNGEIQVALKPDSAAQLEIAGTGYVTTKGAQFRASLRDGQPLVRTTSGQALPIGNFALGLYDKDVAAAVAEQQQTAPRKYLIKPLNLGTNTEIRARSTRNLQVRVTDENDRPVPDAPVLFLFGAGGANPGGAGSFAGQSLQATTNAQGVAQVNYTAGDQAGSNTRIRVQVQGSDAFWEGTLNIIAAKAGFWSAQNAVPIFSVLGAAVGLGVYKAATRDPARLPTQVETRTGGTVVLP